MMPNLLPFLGANLVVAMSQAVLASIGLEALGLGAPSEPTLGQTIYWMMNKSAFMLGMWWWIIEPIAMLIILFVGLFLLTAGLDEIANPRLRRSGGLTMGLQVRDLERDIPHRVAAWYARSIPSASTSRKASGSAWSANPAPARRPRRSP